jgi:hypothetical protein
MVFSSLSEKADSIRWPGEPVGGLSARAPDLGCPPCGRKKTCEMHHPAGFVA